MQSKVTALKPAEKEVHRTAHSQDMVAVPRRARLDREAEGKRLELPVVEPVGQG
ncbi:MAG: hypothetical protein ACLQHF_07825 [Terracidiphilus sp.]